VSVLVFLTHPSGVLRELPKCSRKTPEENNKKTGIGYDEIKNTQPVVLKIYFTEDLHAL
jgi:hypothetical protein